MPKGYAIDTVKILKPLLGHDKRSKHKDEIVLRSLQVTEEEYGPYKFETIDGNMTPGRALISIQDGEMINTFIIPSNDEWDAHAIAIKIPVRQGLLSYRLLLVNKANLDKFSKVKTLADLSQLTAGLHNGWVTTSIFKAAGMKTLTAHNYEGLFLMLSRNRFDYIPRAIYEIYDELHTRKSELKDIVVEPTLALYLPMVTYVYVSPKEPRLAKRIEAGLRILIASGEINTILNKYYAEDIARADLSNRTIIKIDNPNFEAKELLQNQSLWLE
ncbi:substrate-binding periplasmic protein [Colwellia echini]|nr:transporter substrate-binding domain-containing protein [Colwellia echini]